jgi:hypothetical protein
LLPNPDEKTEGYSFTEAVEITVVVAVAVFVAEERGHRPALTLLRKMEMSHSLERPTVFFGDKQHVLFSLLMTSLPSRPQPVLTQAIRLYGSLI